MRASVTAPESKPTNAIVTADHYGPLEGGRGDFDQSEIQIPRLSVVHGVGELASSFNPGSLVYNREVLLPQPLPVTIFGFKKFYIANTEYDPEVRQVRLNSKEEVIAAGGNFDIGKAPGEDPDNFKAGADFFLALEVPETLAHIPGTIDFEDKFIVRAIFTLQKTAYTKNIQRINFVESALRLRKLTIPSQSWSLKVTREKLRVNFVQMPKFEAAGINSTEFVEFLRTIFS